MAGRSMVNVMDIIRKNNPLEKQGHESHGERAESPKRLSPQLMSLKIGKEETKFRPTKKGDEDALRSPRKSSLREYPVLEGTLRVHSQTFLKQDKQKEHYFCLFPASKSGRARLQQYSKGDCAYNKLAQPELTLLSSDVIKVEDLDNTDSDHNQHLTFLIQTKDHLLVLSANSAKEKDQWISVVQETLLSDCDSPTRKVHQHFCSTENVSLPRTFFVRISKKTQVRIGDDSPVDLVVDAGFLSVIASNKVRLVKWPVVMLRKYGFTNSTFYVEAGKKTEAGEGEYEFLTEEGEDIHRAVRAAKRPHSTEVEPMRGFPQRPSPTPPLPDPTYEDGIYEPVEPQPFRPPPLGKSNVYHTRPSGPSSPTKPAGIEVTSFPPVALERIRTKSSTSQQNNPMYNIMHRSTFSEGIPDREPLRPSGGLELMPNKDLSKSVTAFPICPRKTPIVDTIERDAYSGFASVPPVQFHNNSERRPNSPRGERNSPTRAAVPGTSLPKPNVARNEQLPLKMHDGIAVQNSEAIYAEVDKSKKSKKP